MPLFERGGLSTGDRESLRHGELTPDYLVASFDANEQITDLLRPGTTE